MFQECLLNTISRRLGSGRKRSTNISFPQCHRKHNMGTLLSRKYDMDLILQKKNRVPAPTCAGVKIFPSLTNVNFEQLPLDLG